MKAMELACGLGSGFSFTSVTWAVSHALHWLMCSNIHIDDATQAASSALAKPADKCKQLVMSGSLGVGAVPAIHTWKAMLIYFY